MGSLLGGGLADETGSESTGGGGGGGAPGSARRSWLGDGRVVGRLEVVDERELLVVDLDDGQNILYLEVIAAGRMVRADSGAQLLAPYPVPVHLPLTRRTTPPSPLPCVQLTIAHSP